MAVVDVAQEMADSPHGSFTWKGHELTRAFIVRTDDYEDGPVVVKAAPELPVRGDTYQINDGESSEFCICKSVECKRIGPRHLIWVVMCKFETIESSDKAQTTAEEIAAWQEPQNEIPLIKITQEIYQKPVFGAIDPTITDPEAAGFQEETLAIVNSAGEIYTPPIMRDYTRMVVNITRYEPGEDFEDVLEVSSHYQNTINKDYFWNYPPHTAKMHPFGIERVSRTVGETGELKIYLRVTYTIHFDINGWDVTLLDNGNNFLSPAWDGATPPPPGPTRITKPFKTKQGTCYRGLLDGNGNPLAGVDAAGVPRPVPTSTAPFYLAEKQIYPERNFGDLNLPQSILGV